MKQCALNQKWIMDKFKAFPKDFKYFNLTRKKYWLKNLYAGNVKLMSNNKKKKKKKEIQIEMRVYAGSWVEKLL